MAMNEVDLLEYAPRSSLARPEADGSSLATRKVEER